MAELDPALTLRPDTAFFILLKARAFDAKVEPVDPDEGSNPSDDKAIDVLEFQSDDPVEEELTAAIRALNEDERLDLIALIWIGRGDFTFAEWRAARDGARRIDRRQAPRYVLGIPTVSDHLQDALSELGFSLDEYLDSGLHGPVAPETGEDLG